MTYSFFDLFSFAIGFLLLFLALMQLTYRKKAPITYLSVLLYVLMAYILLYFWAFQTRALDRCPWLVNSDLVASFLLAPTLYLYFRTLTGDEPPLSRRHARLFLPALAALVILAVLKWTGGQSSPTPLCTSGLLTEVLGSVSDLWIGGVLFYVLYANYRLFTGNRLREKIELRILLVFLAVAAANAVLMMASYLWHKDDWLIFSTFGFGFLLVVYTLYAYRYPEFAQTVIKEVKSLRYENTYLKHVNTRDLAARLDRLMLEEKIFSDADLTLPRLSARLQVTPHQLSQFLNQRFRMNFRSFLNSHRLREAKRLLRDQQAMSILDIAYASGFNSKSTFNAFFLQAAGLTPSEFRKNRCKPHRA